MPEAIEDYTRAIELNPSFGEAYYNRGLIQIYLKDTRKGCLDHDARPASWAWPTRTRC